MNNHCTRCFTLTSLVLIVFFMASGCASTAPEAKLEPVFFPEPPSLARVQFLTSFISSMDVEQKKSAFSKFVTGKKDLIRRLDKPYGVAIQEGRVYVCDSNHTVMVFDLNNNTFEQMKGAQGRGKLVQPINISIDKDGNKYVSDPIRQQVVMFDRNDFFVNTYGTAGNWKPVDAVAYEDKLYVADAKNAEIKVFNLSSGEIVQTFGKIGEKKDWLSIPTNLAFDSEGMLYVSDTGRFQIMKFDRDGNVRGTIGKLGSQLGYFARPRGVALDKENRVYAVDAAFDNVQMFTKEGQLLLFFGKAGMNRGELYLPAKVLIDYKNIKYFEKYIDPSFEVEALVLVTSQFGPRGVSIFGLGKEKGKKYPTEEELKKVTLEAQKKLLKENPDAAKEEEGQKTEKKE